MKRFKVLALLSVLSAAAHAQVVYSNLTGMNLFEGTMSSGFNVGAEEGDQLALGPGSRTITDAKSIIRAVYATGTTTAFNFDVTMRLRALEGGVPGTILYSNTMQLRNLAEGAYTLDWSAIPSVVVPDTVIMSFSYVRQGGNTGSVGEDFGGTPTVGSSDPNMYWSTAFSGGWQQRNFPVSGRANMAAELTAAPEPSTLFLLSMGALALVRNRRR
jgi:hypothetical protein